MSNPGDELILGPQTGRTRDSDGDGVTDTQEGLDGTDPNDPNSLLRRVNTGLPPNGDPQGGPGLASLEGNIIIDVTANVPAGKSIEQNLPTGLDGKAIPTTHQHHGNADADKMFGTQTDSNSPLNMTRNPVGDTTTGTPSYGTASGTMTSVGQSGDSKSFSGSNSAPPDGAELGTRAPNTGLVSNGRVNGKEINTFQEGTQASYRVDPAEARRTVQSFDKEPPSWWEQKKTEWKQLFGGGSSDGMDNLGAAGDKKKDMVDPDSGGGVEIVGGVISTEQIERAIAVAGGDTDYVEGYGGGAQIEADGPPKRPIDLVTDGGADDPTGEAAGEAAGSTRVTVPGLEISKPINPQDDILGGPPPTGGQGGGQGGGGNTGRVGVSNAATAAEAVAAPETADVAGGATGVVNIGGGQTGGIATVGVEDGAGADADTDTDADADADAADTVPDANAPIKDAALVEDASPVEDASRMEDPAPLEDPAPMEDPAPAPVDPVADAMLIEALHVAPAEVFVAEVAPVDLLIRNEPGLDDGF